MITVHHLNSSRSFTVLWLLEELGLPYEVKYYTREPTMAAPPSLKEVHPLGKSPVIEDDGEVVAESGAIVEYLVEKAGGRLGPPADRDGKLRYRYFLHYAEGSLMAVLVRTLMTERMAPEAARGQLRQSVADHLDYVEAELGQGPWIAGEAFTAADVLMGFPLQMAADRFDGLTGRPNTAKWLAAAHTRPAYQAAKARDKPQA